jgi:hypothetical protein
MRGRIMTFKDGMRSVHPGEVLREEYLKPLGLSANALAKALRDRSLTSIPLKFESHHACAIDHGFHFAVRDVSWKIFRLFRFECG